MKKKLLSLAMAMTMVICMAPLGVLADDGDGVIDTEEELTAALEAGGEIVLGGDITLMDTVYINADTTLDLNGHTITLSVYSSELLWSYGSIDIGYETECDVIIKDSADGGAIMSDEWADGVSVYSSLTVESGIIDRLDVYGKGILNINGGIINAIDVSGYGENIPTVLLQDAATVKAWDIASIATFNFNPADYLYTGFLAVDNGDGTYTTAYEAVEETGETYTLYFYDWYDEINTYYLGNGDMENPGPADELVVNILYVKGNPDDKVLIPMTKLDSEGKYWSAEIDVAYKNAVINFCNEEAGISTFLLSAPDKEGVMYSIENDWTIYGMDDTIDNMTTQITGYDKATVTADDKASLEAVIKSVNEQLENDTYLTAAQKAELEGIKKTAEELIAAIGTNDNNKTDDNKTDTDNKDTDNKDEDDKIVNGGAPASGDSNDIYLWLAVVFAAVAAFISVKLRRDEKED